MSKHSLSFSPRAVPVIEFEDSQYSVNRSDAGNITLCLVFDEYATAAEFPVTVFITSGKGMIRNYLIHDGLIDNHLFCVQYLNSANRSVQGPMNSRSESQSLRNCQRYIVRFAGEITRGLRKASKPGTDSTVHSSHVFSCVNGLKSVHVRYGIVMCRNYGN